MIKKLLLCQRLLLRLKKTMNEEIIYNFSIQLSTPIKDNKGYSEESEKEFWKRACEETMRFIQENSPT